MTIDTNKLRQLAQETMHPVTKGRWMRLFGERTVYDRMEDGCRGTPVVSTDKHPPSLFEAACLDFVAAANPAAITELLDQLEAVEKERDAAELMSRALHAKIEAMEKQEPVGVLHVGSYYGEELQDWEFEADQRVCDRLNERHVTNPTSLNLYALPGAKGEEK